MTNTPDRSWIGNAEPFCSRSFCRCPQQVQEILQPSIEHPEQTIFYFVAGGKYYAATTLIDLTQQYKALRSAK